KRRGHPGQVASLSQGNTETHRTNTPRESPEDIVTGGVEVLHDLTSVASACALLLGLIYALNLAYPKPLRFTFEVFQKIFMQLDQHKIGIKIFYMK
uniref:Uncharacterized protein n=1 Tax=Poecilia reticulata TaxID=8081 RepID=A0A3P9P978_POERE